MYQCTDLGNAYIRDVLGLRIIEWTNAVDFPSKAGDKYEYIKNTPTGVPQAGDLMIWGKSPGHIAIFVSGDTNKFTSFDQNWPVKSPSHLQEHTYTNVLGWLHPKEVPMAEVCIFKDNSEKKWWNGETKDAREWFDIAKYHRGQEENSKERATVAEKALQIANDELKNVSGERDKVLSLNEDLANKLAEERSTVTILNGKIVDNGNEILRLTTERNAARNQLSSAEKELEEAHDAYDKLKEDIDKIPAPEPSDSPTGSIPAAFEALIREIILYVKKIGR